MKYLEHLNILGNLGTNEMLQEHTLKGLESLVCKMHGYKNLSSVSEVRNCIFTSKYEKGKKSLDLCVVPPCQEKLKLHMRRANYVTRTFISTNMLQMDLNSPFEHGWDGLIEHSQKIYLICFSWWTDIMITKTTEL